MRRPYFRAIPLLGLLAACGPAENPTATAPEPQEQRQKHALRPQGGGSFQKDARNVERRLYVANDDGQIDIFDVNDSHKKIRSIPVPGLKRARGLSAHPGTGRLYVDCSKGRFVAAIDLETEQILWKKKFSECNFPDRLNVTADGAFVYVPCKEQNTHAIFTKDGEYVKSFPLSDAPHNSWTGEQGKYMYLSAYRNETVLAVDTKTKEVARRIGPYSSGVRPFAANREETRLYATLTKLRGFAAADIETGNVLYEVEASVPPERSRHSGARTDRPHGGEPFSHGLGVRPNTNEVWVIDDEWGYFYAYDVSTEPPTHLANVELFTDITKKWTTMHWRWVAFSLEGDYAYPGGEGIVVDAKTKKMTSMKITPSEKLLEVQWKYGKPFRASGQQGGRYPE